MTEHSGPNTPYPLHRLAAWKPRLGSIRIWFGSIMWALVGLWAWICDAGLIQDAGPPKDRNHMGSLPPLMVSLFGLFALVFTLVSLWRWEERQIKAPDEARKRIHRLEAEVFDD